MLAARSPLRVADVVVPEAARWADTAWLLVLGVLLLGLGLGDYPLWDPGEGRNAQAAREMAAAGRWLVPLLYGEPYHDKPAALFALLRATQALLGETELALRLPSALATLATAAVLHRFALPRFGRVAAALATTAYLTSPEVVALGRFCNFDALLTLCTTVAITRWLAWLDRMRSVPWLAWIAMGCGVLVKGPVAIVLPLAVAVASAWRRGIVARAWRAARPDIGLAILSLLVLPWLVAAALADPEYVRTFLLRHNVERYVSSDFAHVRHPLFYVPVIAGGFFPWSLLLPLALRSRALRGPAADAGLWAAVVVGFFSLGQGKLATYVLPAFPALALLVAALACEDGPARASAARRARFVRVAAAVWAFVLIALPGGILVYTRSFYPALAGATLLALPLPLLAWLGVARLRVERFATLPACIVFAAVNVVLLTTFYGRAAPVVSAVASDASIAEVVRRTPDAIPVIAFRVQPASLSWYGGRAVRRVGDVAELRDAARRGPLLIVTRRRHEQALRDAGLPLHEWLDTRRHLLYATVPVS